MTTTFNRNLPTSTETGLHVLGECKNNACKNTAKAVWINLKTGTFNAPHFFYDTPCPECRTSLDNVHTYVIQGFKYRWEGRKKDGTILFEKVDSYEQKRTQYRDDIIWSFITIKIEEDSLFQRIFALCKTKFQNLFNCCPKFF